MPTPPHRLVCAKNCMCTSSAVLPQVPQERFKIVELRKAVLVEGVTVTYFDANHCPGAPPILYALPYLHLVLTVSRVSGVCALQESCVRRGVGPMQPLSIALIKRLAVAGAAMILFEVPGHRPVLHTGDFR